LARLLDIPLSDALRDNIAEDQFLDAPVTHDLADFYSSGSSGTWEGRLTADDVQDYAVRMAGVLLTPKDVAWLDWGDSRTP
jgi:hypothetical protein